jgi:hypothetical protein
MPNHNARNFIVNPLKISAIPVAPKIRNLKLEAWNSLGNARLLEIARTSIVVPLVAVHAAGFTPRTQRVNLFCAVRFQNSLEYFSFLPKGPGGPFRRFPRKGLLKRINSVNIAVVQQQVSRKKAGKC